MITDPLRIKFSNARRYDTAAPNQTAVINKFAVMLPACGWTLRNAYKATVTISYPFGFPTVNGVQTSFPKTAAGCASTGFVTVGGTKFTPYDPFNEVSTPGDCAFFALAVSPTDGLNNLAIAISNSTAFDAGFDTVSPGVYSLTLVAKLPGPESNFSHVAGDGRWGAVTGPPAGGGYQWESANGAAVYRVAITGEPSIFGTIRFDFLINGNLPTQVYRLNQASDISTPMSNYQIVCNGYGFAIFDGTDADRVVSLMAWAPYRPVSTDPDIPRYEVFNPGAYAVFICGPRSFRAHTEWSGPTITTALDGDANTYSGGSGWPRILAYRAPGPPLIATAGVPLIIAAYVMLGPSQNVGASVIGKLYDCAVVHGVVGGPMIIQNQRFIPISSQAGNDAGTATTLMFCVPPVAEHSTGTCNFLGTAVIRLTGPSWTSDMVGGPITIGGIPYTVTSFTSGDQIGVSDDSVIQTGLTWSIP